MSEYQYYEFAAVDRPLDDRQLAMVRSLSTRAHITPTSFVNTYEWGDFKGDPRALVEHCFDGFLHLTNWGTNQVMLRFPIRLLDLETARRYCSGDFVSAWSTDEHVIVAAASEEDEPEFDRGGEGVLGSILPVRSEVLAGDLGALYLLWLLGVQDEEIADEDLEPPVPPSLADLTGSQHALAEFLRISSYLIDVAAEGADLATEEDETDLTEWVARLAAGERDALLVGLLEGHDPLLRVETLRRARGEAPVSTGTRTAGELRARADARLEAVQRIARERADARARESARRAEEARQARLAALTAEGDRAWTRVDARIAEKTPSGYDVAVGLLTELCEVTDPAVFVERVRALRVTHARKVSFVDRLDRAGL